MSLIHKQFSGILKYCVFRLFSLPTFNLVISIVQIFPRCFGKVVADVGSCDFRRKVLEGMHSVASLERNLLEALPFCSSWPAVCSRNCLFSVVCCRPHSYTHTHTLTKSWHCFLLTWKPESCKSHEPYEVFDLFQDGCSPGWYSLIPHWPHKLYLIKWILLVWVHSASVHLNNTFMRKRGLFWKQCHRIDDQNGENCWVSSKTQV